MFQVRASFQAQLTAKNFFTLFFLGEGRLENLSNIENKSVSECDVTSGPKLPALGIPHTSGMFDSTFVREFVFNL